MSFAAIIATRNGTEGSNFHIRNTMTAIVEVSGNRLVCIVACDRATVLAKPSPQTSSSFSNVKHATCTASLRSRRYSRAQGGKLEIPPAQKLTILSSPAAG